MWLQIKRRRNHVETEQIFERQKKWEHFQSSSLSATQVFRPYHPVCFRMFCKNRSLKSNKRVVYGLPVCQAAPRDCMPSRCAYLQGEWVWWLGNECYNGIIQWNHMIVNYSDGTANHEGRRFYSIRLKWNQKRTATQRPPQSWTNSSTFSDLFCIKYQFWMWATIAKLTAINACILSNLSRTRMNLIWSWLRKRIHRGTLNVHVLWITRITVIVFCVWSPSNPSQLGPKHADKSVGLLRTPNNINIWMTKMQMDQQTIWSQWSW